MARELEMGACGYLGSILKPRSSAVTGPANSRFRISVNQSCSGMASESPRERYVQFIAGFTGNGSDGQK